MKTRKRVNLIFLVVAIISFSLALPVSHAQGQGQISLPQWLKTHPQVASAMLMDEVPWPKWSTSDQKILLHDYASEEQQKSSQLPSTLPNLKSLRDLDFPKTVFAPSQAKRLYLASVAHSLFLETHHPNSDGSIAHFSASALGILFNEREFFEWDSLEKGYALNEDRSGLVSPAPPALVASFLKKNRIIARTRKATIANLIRWASDLTHDISSADARKAGYKRETAIYQDHFWHYRGFPPVSQIIAGTSQNLVPNLMREVRHWTAGCWGTAGFFRAVLRVANIPVEIKNIQGHAVLHFPTENLYLSHADDPYNQNFKNLAERPLPAEKLLLSDQLWPTFGDQVGYGPLRLRTEKHSH